jgi:hypothetical protein
VDGFNLISEVSSESDFEVSYREEARSEEKWASSWWRMRNHTSFAW